MSRTSAGDKAKFALHAIAAMTFCVLLVIVLLLQLRLLCLVLAPFALLEGRLALHYLNGLIGNRAG